MTNYRLCNGHEWKAVMMIMACLMGYVPLAGQEPLTLTWFHRVKPLIQSAPDSALAEARQRLQAPTIQEDPLGRGYANFVLGRVYRTQRLDLPRATKAFEEAVQAFGIARDSLMMGRSLRNLGVSLSGQGNWKLAEAQLNRACLVLAQQGDSLNWGFALNSLGSLHKSQGSFIEAQTSLRQALDIGQALGDAELQAYAWNNLGTCHDEAGEHPEALAAYERAIEWLEVMGYRKAIATVRINQGRIYAAKGQDSLALAAWYHARSLLDQPRGFRDRILLGINIGNYWRDRGDSVQARQHFLEALDFAQQTGHLRYESVIRRGLGVIAIESGQPAVGLPQLYQGLRLTAPDFHPQYDGQLPSAQEISMTFEAIHHAQYLGRAWWQLAAQDTVSPLAREQSWSAYMLAIDLIDQLRLSQSASVSQAHVAAINHSVFREAMSLAWLRWQQETIPTFREAAWQILERSHGFLLWQAQQTEASPSTRMSVLSLAETQAQLTAGEGMLAYFAGKDHWYVFAMRADSLVWLQLDSVSHISSEVAVLRQQLMTSVEPADSLDNSYERSAYSLYQQLWEPVADLLPSQVIILPDGALFQLPFDALLSEIPPVSGRYRDYVYLLHKHSLRYAYGAAIRQSPSPSATTIQTLSLAPFHAREASTAHPDLPTLWHSAAELAAVKAWTAGENLLGAEASYAKLLAGLAGKNCLHISSHAWTATTPRDTPQLALADTLIDLRTIQASFQPLDLVVLSACETGQGQYLPGEATLSLGWAFCIAGAASTISTLWAVQDRATGQIMETFYEAMCDRGRPKSEALREARLAYLASHEHRLAHPYYWAGWIMMGDDRALPGPTASGPSPLLWGGILLGLGIVIGGWIRRRMRQAG